MWLGMGAVICGDSQSGVVLRTAVVLRTVRRSLGACWGEAHLQGDVGLRPDLGGGQFHVGVFAHKVDGDELLAPRAGEARGAATGRLLLYHDALGPILALVLVTGTGLKQDHGWGLLTEEPAGRRGEKMEEE